MKAAGCLWGQVKLFHCRTIFVDKKNADTRGYGQWPHRCRTPIPTSPYNSYTSIRSFATTLTLYIFSVLI